MSQLQLSQNRDLKMAKNQFDRFIFFSKKVLFIFLFNSYNHPTRPLGGILSLAPKFINSLLILILPHFEKYLLILINSVNPY